MLDFDAGIARYIRFLLEAFSQLPLSPGEEISVAMLWRSSRWRRRGRLPAGPRLAPQMWRSRQWPLRRPYDVVHCPCDWIPPWSGPAYVATIHDLYAALGYYFEDPVRREQQMQVYRELARRSTRVICVSENTRADFLRLIGGDVARVHVIHPGVRPVFQPRAEAECAALRRSYELPRPYLLFVGSASSNKNLGGVIRAFARSATRRDFDLVLAGGGAQRERTGLLELVARLGLSERVHLPGFVADADLPLMYAAAAGFVFPSLYEGFGVPILEAMAAGVPVLTSTVSSCPEVAAGHAELVDPHSEEDIAAGMERIVEMSPKRRAAARAYAQGKTWSKAAAATLAVYRQAAAER